MQWLLASATAEADDASHCWLDARDARDRAASQELLLESERRRVLASLRGAEAARRAEDAAAFARGAATRDAASAAAEDQRLLLDAVSATRLHADVQRSFPRAVASEHRDWCSHLADLRLIQARLSISDTVLFYNVAQTLTGRLLHTWRGFMLSTQDEVERAAPDDPCPWPLLFEHLVVTQADFLRSEASWRSLSQLTDPSLSLPALMRAYETAFVSWGRHATSVLEATRVAVFLQALSQRYRDYLGMPGSPLRGPDAAPSFRDCCAWLRSFERFAPPTALGVLGACPVVAAGRDGRTRGLAGRGRGHGRRSPPGADPRLRCVRCFQRGHAASDCAVALRPATVRTNVLRCWMTRRDGACFVCSSPAHPTQDCPSGSLPAELLAVWPADSSSDHSSGLSVNDDILWPGLARAAVVVQLYPSAILTVAVAPAPPSSPAAMPPVVTGWPVGAFPPPPWTWRVPSVDSSFDSDHSSDYLTDYSAVVC